MPRMPVNKIEDRFRENAWDMDNASISQTN